MYRCGHGAQPEYVRLLLLARNKVIIKAQDTGKR